MYTPLLEAKNIVNFLFQYSRHFKVIFCSVVSLSSPGVILYRGRGAEARGNFSFPFFRTLTCYLMAKNEAMKKVGTCYRREEKKVVRSLKENYHNKFVDCESSREEF